MWNKFKEICLNSVQKNLQVTNTTLKNDWQDIKQKKKKKTNRKNKGVERDHMYSTGWNRIFTALNITRQHPLVLLKEINWTLSKNFEFFWRVGDYIMAKIA